MVEHQGPRRHAAVQIIVHGMQDVTSRLHPYLISVQVIDKHGEADECHIELDDRNAELIIPPNGVVLQVAMGWDGDGPNLFDSGKTREAIRTPEEIKQEARFGGPGLRLVFDGWVEEVESGFGRRGGGRRMWITARGHDGKGLAKETQQGFVGEGKPVDGQEGQKIPMKDMMTKVFGAAGMSVAMSPAMEKISRDYWSWNDSPANLGQRMAEETGGIFKMAGNTATIVDRNTGKNALGDDMPMIEAIWGINLIGWRIKPFTTRPDYGGSQAKFFDLAKGAYQMVKGSIDAPGAPYGGKAIANAANTVMDKDHGEQSNSGTGALVDAKRGIGWVLLNGEPNAKTGGTISIDGARPGVDGMYSIDEVEHNYTRGVGFTTRCNVTNPRPSGGYDTWKKEDSTELQPGDPGFIGPMPWPDVPAQEQTYALDELQKLQEAQGMREQSQQARADGLVPITRDELPADGKVPDGYVLVGPLPDPPKQSTDPLAPGYVPAPPISGEQTFTADDLALARAGQLAEVERQQRIDRALAQVRADQIASGQLN